MIVVCDSSALINLSKIHQLRLLESMFGGVLISPGIHDEVVKKGGGRAGAKEVGDADFIQVQSLRNPDDVQLYTGQLSQEDAELIVVAKEQKADLIITRDRGLRRRARREGIEVVNLVSLFESAKKRGYIESVKTLLDELRDKGVLIREGVYREALRRAGELEDGKDTKG